MERFRALNIINETEVLILNTYYVYLTDILTVVIKCISRPYSNELYMFSQFKIFKNHARLKKCI